MMDHKRVLVTGAGAGMGREIAIESARRHAELVCLADRDEAGARETAEAVEAAGARAHVIVVDLLDREAVRTMVADAVDAGGGLDTLINNAGVIDTAFMSGPTAENLPESVWDTVLAVNLTAVWLASKHAAPHLRASTRGPSIVNAASVSGMTGYVTPAYAVSKAAVVQLTRTTAIALSPEVRCNAFCPGSVDTPMARAHLDAAEDRQAQQRGMTGTHLIPRFGRVDEIAKSVCFLAGDDASFITGVALPVDGGTLAWRGVRT